MKTNEVVRYISGRNNSITISIIKKLCDGLGITIEEFFSSELFTNLEQKINDCKNRPQRPVFLIYLLAQCDSTMSLYHETHIPDAHFG